ncbi:MAG TPA: YybS family protein [Firmicutes bacterium]|nr:YybS family protein [Bacillota bacterium]HHY98933.1 YybS family protein [Bacillota bacterium]
MQDRTSTKAMVEGALLVSITILLCVLDTYIPFLALVYPIPIVVLVTRHGLRSGVLATLIAVLGTSVITGPIQGVTVLAKVGIAGVSLGECLRRKLAPALTIGITSIAVALSVALLFGISAAAFGFSLAQLEREFTTSIQSAISLYRNLGMPEKELATAKQSLEQMLAIAKISFPAIVLLAVIMLSVINYLLATFVLRRLRYEIPTLPKFQTWHLAWYWGWGYILGGVLTVLGQYYHQDIIFRTGFNLMAVFSYIFLIQGLSIAWFFMDRYKVSIPVRYLLVFFLAFTRLFSQVLVWAGLLDGWFDFRKIRARAA